MRTLIKTILALALALCLCVAAGAEGVDVSSLKVTAPGGAPALALAALAVENPGQYTYVAADTIAAAFADKEADFIIAPVNAGAKLYKAGKSTYKLAAVVSWGNLYIAAQREDLKPEDLNGATITLFGENTINASVVLYALQANGIEPAKVEYLAGAADTQSLLLTDEEAIVVTAEPALTAATMKNSSIEAIAVNDLFWQATGDDGYAQAGLFVKAETAETQPEAVAAYLDLAEQACDLCMQDVETVSDAAVQLEILPNVKVALSAIPRCAIRFVAAPEAKALVEKTAQIDLSQFGGAVPADDFYYGAE
ncbi:MAG: ABC transporter substrate-binding protein [Clostridia bacterium]|nr:ABC transporter substrate-binding protein [Clostridia bacterium]